MQDKPTFLESVREKLSPSSSENKPPGNLFVFVQCVPILICPILEITRQDILEADERVKQSARGLLGTIHDTYVQKKHGKSESSPNRVLLVLTLTSSFCKLIDLMDSASSAKESIESTVGESLHSKMTIKLFVV